MKCRATGKQCLRTPLDAEQMIEELVERKGESWMALHYYRCNDCGYFHVGHLHRRRHNQQRDKREGTA